MANTTTKRTGELLRVLFKVLIEHPDGMQARDAISAVREQVTLTEYESGTYKNDQPRFGKIVRFATIDCVKAGWMLKVKGRWSITEEGIEAFNMLTDPEEFYRRAGQLYRKWHSEHKVIETDSGDEGDPEEQEKEASITYEQAEELAWSEISEYLIGMNPYEFQELVADLLKAMGYFPAWVAPPGKDGGVDIIAYNDPLGATMPRVKVQVKRVQDKISVDGLRSFMAVLGDDDVGLFVTTSDFTRDAHSEARTQEKRKITLINLQRLFDLWVEHYSRLDETAKRKLPLKPIYFLSPEG